MNVDKELIARANSKCELCARSHNLSAFEVKPSSNRGGDDYVLVCETCLSQLNDAAKIDINHWRCLNESMWSEVKAVQVVAWRMLNQLKSEGWTQDLLDQMYLEDNILDWAKSGLTAEGESEIVHKDSNGAILSSGDTVVLIKDLDVKGANFTAKRGTAVRGITLVHNNPNQIEGRVNGQQIVILTQFVKK